MKALITGANGFLGAHLTAKLTSQGLDCFALIRPNSDISELSELSKTQRLKFVNGDITHKESLDQVLEKIQPDIIFHLAGYVGYKKSERALMEKVNVQGTAKLLESMVQNKIPRIIHVSSVVAVGAGFTSSQVLDENSNYNLSHLDLGYFETKRKAELLVKQYTDEGRIQSVILNPSTIYGPADAKKGSRKTQLKVAQGKFKFYTSGGVSIVSVEDVIEGIYQGFLKGRNGERYILSGENITIKSLFERIAGFANVPAPKYQIPNWVLHTLGFVGDSLSSVGFKDTVSSENAWSAILYHWFSNEKAKKELGIQFKDANYSLKQSVDWMRAQKLI